MNNQQDNKTSTNESWTEKATQKAGETLSNFKDKAGDLYEKGKDKVSSVTQAIEDKITQRPITSLLIAAGIGMLIGKMCRKKS